MGLGNKGPLAASQGPVPPLPVGLGVHGAEPLPLLPYDRGLLLGAQQPCLQSRRPLPEGFRPHHIAAEGAAPLGAEAVCGAT